MFFCSSNNVLQFHVALEVWLSLKMKAAGFHLTCCCQFAIRFCHCSRSFNLHELEVPSHLGTGERHNFTNLLCSERERLRFINTVK
jgi:hypothetical protein